MATPTDDTLDVTTGQPKKPVGVGLSGLQPGNATDTGAGGIAPPAMSLPPPPLATNDPMAFAPPGPAQVASQGSAGPLTRPDGGTSTTPALSPGDQQAAFDAQRAAAPAKAYNDITAAHDAFSPLAGLSEQQKQQYWAGQGAPVSGAFNSAMPGVADPTKLAALASAGAADPAVSGVQSRQAGALGATNAAIDTNVTQPNIAADALANAQRAFDAGGRFTTQGLNGGGESRPTTSVPVQQEAHPGAPLSPGAPLTNPIPTGGGVSLAPFPSGTPQPPTDVGGAVAPAVGAGGAGGAPASATAVNGGVGLSSIDPNNSLINQVISPNSSVDRVALNQKSLQSTIDNVLNPALNAASRQVATRSFGAGRGVSGQNRTAQGNLASDYGHQLADLTNQSNTGAVNGSIDDLYRNIAQADQQQQFQSGQQSNAFGQDVATRQLQEALTNGAFGRASAQNAAGQSGSPADIGLILSQIFGGQSSAAGQAAAGLFNQAGQKAGGGSSSGIDINAILKALGYGGTPSQSTTDGGYEVGPQ